ncbi:MAG TPA: hypothetical protein VK205_13015, partial [Prolixibacteraceae bacterium]|nr:hypothetical protein [Prolixibacteraceae bacterium]
MNRLKTIIRLSLFSVLTLITNLTQGQFASGVADYLPAPGQYTNADFIGTPSAAASLIGTNRGMVSLGAYGGSVILQFASPIKNDPANPYGVDFTIFGNPTLTWSEPGIVQVMKDENKNGLADDSWYEIAGSDHYWNSTIHDYKVTYFNSGMNTAVDIRWEDNQGSSGIIPANSFHRQTYYPRNDLFPRVPADQVTLTGTRLEGQVDLSVPGVVNSYHRAFGYADNTPVLSLSEKLPDNPYTANIEGSGGDAIDISWAVDASGKHVQLDEINFVRIYTGMNALVGWLGEVSTEITGIRDVEPAAVNGPNSMIVMQDLLPKLWLGQTIPLNALLFESGIKSENALINWTVSDPQIAVVENGKLRSLKAGTFKLRASLAGNPGIFAEKDMEVYSAGKATISLQSNSVKINDKLALSGKLTDQNGNILPGITPIWKVSNEAIAEVFVLDGTFYLKGKQTGSCHLYLESKELASLKDSVTIQVLPESIDKKVFVAVKTSERTLIPRHSIWVETMDITSHVDRPQKSYGLTDTSFVSLADVVAAVYKNKELDNEWAFRDDAEGGFALYLWRIPEDEEGSTVYYSGYGGSRTSVSTRKAWVVMLNQQAYVNGLDKIRVNNNDEVLIYHLTDNSLPWAVSQMTSKTDSLKVNQQEEFQLMKYTCSMNANREVSINASEVMVNQTVTAEAQITAKSSVNFISDEYGKVMVNLESAGRYGLISGIDEATVFVESATGINEINNGSLQGSVYPNPFDNKIFIKGEFKGALVEIADLYGKVVYSAPFTQPEINLPLLS